jgi:hypothetical protein
LSIPIHYTLQLLGQAIALFQSLFFARGFSRPKPKAARKKRIIQRGSLWAAATNLALAY